ncbi:sensor histidine kinase [uncultured Fibrella sp.]|uniref:sensor histidine kinase n=1 Tax=uncultured Fibrella sp. TaxID=1284596 RepID=UPI0035CB6FB7
MKLLHKTALSLLLASLPIALGGVFLLNYYIHRYILHEIDELLLIELTQVKEQLNQHPPAATYFPGWDPNVRVSIATRPQHQPDAVFKDSSAFNALEKEQMPVRMLRSTYSVGSRTYTITLQQSYLEFDEIASALSVGVIVCFLLVVLLLILTDVLVSRRIWQPFYKIIRQLQQYRIDQPEETVFPDSDVSEFGLLSKSLDEMSRRTRHQYAQQKQFTDNASHEMQTPLSVLSFELDLLQQSKQLTETDLDRIQRSQQVIKRLSAMNQSLLLLAKIDNHQFARNESVNIGELIAHLVANYSDFMAHKGMSVTQSIDSSVCRPLNRQLADVLFSNLIKNAVRHGDPDSTIRIQVNAASFMISNEGEPLPFPQQYLFQRFIRNQALAQSTGLGLAIVKEIVEQYSMKVHYNYSPSMRRHTFQIMF